MVHAAREPTGRSTSLLRVARKWWLPPLLCGLVALGMLVGSPGLGPPDSPVNLATAWYDVHHGFPDNARVDLLPTANHGTRPCFTYWPMRNMDCYTSPAVLDITSSTYRITNYPPVYLWIMGVGEVAANAFSKGHLADGARTTGLLACLAVLFLAAWLLSRRRDPNAIWALYLLSPPLALYMDAGANPNAWEICCALLVASTLLYRKDQLLGPRPGWRAIWPVALAALALTMARPSGLVWLILIVGCFAVWTGAWRKPRALLMLGLAAAPGVLCGLVWNAYHPLVVRLGEPTYTITLHNALSRIAASSSDILTRFLQIWGTLGWNDTVPSAAAIVVLVVVLVYYLPTYAPTRKHRVLLAALVALVFVTAAVWQATSWQPAPLSTWWRMRYSLPLLGGVGMLLFTDPGGDERPGILSLAAWVTALNAYMVCLNVWRYDYGIINGFPAQVRHAAYGPLRPGVVYLVAISLLLVAVGLFEAERERRVAAKDASLSELTPV